MTTLMQHENWHRVDEWSDESIGLGHISIGAVNEEVQPICNKNSNKLVVSAGKIFAYEQRKRELINKGYKFVYPDNDAEFALHLSEEWGNAKFRELNGVFACCIWDRANKKLILVNDRYGIRPLYYYFNKEKNLLLFASEIKAISKQDFFEKKIDWDAWNVFLRLGFLIGEDTFFKDIRALPQGSILHFDLKSIKIENYWNYGELKMKATFDEKEDIDNLVLLFKQSIKRRIMPAKKAVVFLSGGLDSRGIAAELKHQGVPFVSYTTKKFYPYEQDKKIASMVAAKLGVENRFCDWPKNFPYAEESVKNNILDYECDEHAWMLPMIDSVPTAYKINYDGIINDLICDPQLYCESNQGYIDLFDAKEYDGFIKNWYYPKRISFLFWPITENKYNLEFFTNEMKYKFSSEVFIEKVKKELLKYEGNPNQYIFFGIGNRTRREIALAPFQLILNKLESFCPYLDNDYFEYAMSLPVTIKRNGTLRAKILNRAYPSISTKDMNSESNIYNNEHEIFYTQSIKYLLKMEGDLLTSTKHIFNISYLYPRLLYDIFKIQTGRVLNNKSNRNLLKSSHNWLVKPLHFLNSWLLNEGITCFK